MVLFILVMSRKSDFAFVIAFAFAFVLCDVCVYLSVRANTFKAIDLIFDVVVHLDYMPVKFVIRSRSHSGICYMDISLTWSYLH